MNRDESEHRDEQVPDRGRRRLLKRAGFAFGVPPVVGSSVYRADRTYADEDGDGIPDSLERSESFHRYLVDVFGSDQFAGLDPERTDMLIDARYVGDAAISEETKRELESLFRANGIHLQWLDYPDRYDEHWFEREYGFHVKDVLWSPTSFYHQQVAAQLKNVAVQLVVVPGSSDPWSYGQLDSFWAEIRGVGDSFAGMSVGNRAVVTEQQFDRNERILVLHEVGHLVLCHDDDPDNTGVMGVESPTTDVDFMESEWETFRNRLDNVRDTTAFDVAKRGCLWETHVLDPLEDRLTDSLRDGDIFGPLTDGA